jgi:hypothetical protein
MVMSLKDEKGSMVFRREPARDGHPDSAAVIVNAAPRPQLAGLQPWPQRLIRAHARAKSGFRRFEE